jgi:hypothetical protein
VDEVFAESCASCCREIMANDSGLTSKKSVQSGMSSSASFAFQLEL